MYTYFFTYQDALPENCGFPLFGGIHFIWLTCIAIGIFLLCRTYLRLTKTRQLQILNTTVLLALCCTFMQDAILTVTGHMNARTLPFHLCDMAGFFYLLLQMQALRTGRWSFLSEIALCLFMPGVERVHTFSLYDDPWFCISCADHSLSMVTFCQWKHSP